VLTTFSPLSLLSCAIVALPQWPGPPLFAAVPGVEPPLPPYQSDMLPLQHRAAIRGGGNRTRCYVRPRHVGHHYPSPRSPNSNSSSGSRTPSSALKGQHPRPVDERARLFRNWDFGFRK
jgi:hypothetical protein